MKEPVTDLGRAAARPPACPRCGYDLRGVMGTWIDAWPLHGVCAECGLEYEWSEILCTTHPPLHWNVEFGSEIAGIPLRIVRTLLTSFKPWRFWSALRMTHEIRWGRIAVYLCVLIASVYVFFALSQTAVVAVDWQQTQNMWRTMNGTPGLPIGPELPRVLLIPLSDQQPMVTPSRGMGVPPYVVYLGLWSGSAILLGWILAWIALCAVGFVALPISRRRAKVRWGHVFRIALYSFALVVPWTVLMMIGTVLHKTRDLSGNVMLTAAATLFSVLGGLWVMGLGPLLVAWWALATKRYLRMPHGWGVGAAVVVIALLLVLLANFGWVLYQSPANLW